MKNITNIVVILVMLGVLSWYGGRWIYSELYRGPRVEANQQIERLTTGIANGKKQIAQMKEQTESMESLWTRSLPRDPSQAQTLYRIWLLQLVDFSDLANAEVDAGSPTRTPFYIRYPYTLRAQCSLDELNQFLYEFYFARYLHRIDLMYLVPIENSRAMNVEIHFEAITVYQPNSDAPYPLREELPQGYYKRLASNVLDAYRPIVERNLLEFSRGNVDEADYTYLTAINFVDGKPEAWFTTRTSGAVKLAELNETIKAGSFTGKLIDASPHDVVLQYAGQRWLLAIGERVSNAFALPPEY